MVGRVLCIIREISLVAFGLDLPLGWLIHPVFYMSKLKCSVHLEDFLWEIELLSPILMAATVEYDVEGIL